MLLYARLLSSLKPSVLVLIYSATLLLADTAIPGIDAVAKAQQSAPAPASTSATSLLTSDQLVELVGPIALYPDELISIVLPASTYPIQIVQAARYLENRKKEPKLQPDKAWDASILGLLNYPEVIEKMNGNLDWTWKLGEAVVAQQNDVMDTIQQFRNTAYTAGNLNSDKKTIIIQEKQIIKIESATPEVIYVPSYNPQIVIISQPAPYLYHYSAPYPYYYSPAATFWTGMFVGTAVSYGVGWNSHGHHHVNINHNTNISGGNRNVNIGGNKWSPNRGGGQVGRPGAVNRPGTRPGARTGGVSRSNTGQRLSAGAGNFNRGTPSRSRMGNAGSFGGYKGGQNTFRDSQRGQMSRASQSSNRMSRSSMSRGGGSSFGGAGRSRSGGGRRR